MAAADKIRRILTLVEQLQSGRSYNARQLADLCGVSHRTMFRDLNVLIKSGVPVLYDNQRRGYSLPAARFLPPTDLTLQEALALIILANELGNQERGVPFQDAARTASLKFISQLNGPLRNWLGEITSASHVRTEPKHPLDQARPHYELLQQAIGAKQKVRLRYHSLYDGGEIGLLLSPYALLFSRCSWYLIGRSSLHRSVRTFHLGRILESTLTEDRFTPPPRFSVSRQLGLAWHLIREAGQRTRVVIRFKPMVAHNVAEVIWHQTQEIKTNKDGSIDFSVTVDGLNEIAWWVLGYGDQAEVLEPPALRTLIAERARKMVKMYEVKQSNKRKQRRKTKANRVK